jgi:hypothetical protein
MELKKILYLATQVNTKLLAPLQHTWEKPLFICVKEELYSFQGIGNHPHATGSSYFIHSFVWLNFPIPLIIPWHLYRQKHRHGHKGCRYVHNIHILLFVPLSRVSRMPCPQH